MTAVSVLDIGRYLPGEPVGTDYYAERIDADERLNWSHPMFKPPKYRHLTGPDESAADMLERAGAALLARVGNDVARETDIILTNVLLPDLPHAGVGATLAHRIGARPGWVLDLHNAGCASFIVMLRMAMMIMQTTPARTALLCNVQNCAGPVFTQSEIVAKPPSAIPGDGASVAFVAASEVSPVLDIEIANYPEAAQDMRIETGDDRKYWEPGTGQLNVKFTESSVAKIISRGNRIVPEVVGAVCSRVGVKTSDIDTLISNQPSRMFLRNWADALQLDPKRHLDTFDKYGNLFGAGVPITLSHAIEDDTLASDSLLMLSGFAHAGDLGAAAAIRWRAGA